MKSILRVLSLITLLAVMALPASALADERKFGAELSDTAQVVSVDELKKNPDAYLNKLVRVEGVVTNVCEHRGCWITVGGDDFQEVRVKVKDGEIVFPVDVKGKTAVAEGVWTKHVITKEQAIKRGEHHAEETGETFDPSTITGDQTFYQIQGVGAVIK